MPAAALVRAGAVSHPDHRYAPAAQCRGVRSPELITTAFTATSTAADVLQGVDLTGLRAIVTGVSSGIGVETARALARGRRTRRSEDRLDQLDGSCASVAQHPHGVKERALDPAAAEYLWTVSSLLVDQ